MKSIERTPVVQQVVDSIRDYIREEGHLSGDKLPTEKEFCEQLGIGRSTLREAFRMLQAQGYVENKPGRGAFIASKDGSSGDAQQWLAENKVTLKDFTEVRMAVEELAVRLAIERATKDEIKSLARLHKEYLEATEKDDLEHVAQLDARFHGTIAEMTHNMLLISVNQSITERLEAFRSQTFRIPRNKRNSIGPHAAIVDAFIHRDAARGVREMHQHLEKLLEDLETEPPEEDAQ